MRYILADFIITEKRVDNLKNVEDMKNILNIYDKTFERFNNKIKV